MASIYDLKPAFQNVLRPFMHLLAQKGVTPNQITGMAIGLSILGGGLIALGSHYPQCLLGIPLLLLVRMGLNALDGMLAREYTQSSMLGEILNEVGDIFSDTVLYLPLMLLFAHSILTLLMIAAFSVLSALTEFCGVLSKSMTGVRRYDGPMGKSDRAFVISLLVLAVYFVPGWAAESALYWFGVLNGLLVWSVVNRLKFILRFAQGDAHE